MDWQTLLALGIALAAALFVARLAYAWLRRVWQAKTGKRDCASGCGGCDKHHSDTEITEE